MARTVRRSIFIIPLATLIGLFIAPFVSALHFVLLLLLFKLFAVVVYVAVVAAAAVVVVNVAIVVAAAAAVAIVAAVVVVNVAIVVAAAAAVAIVAADVVASIFFLFSRRSHDGQGPKAQPQNRRIHLRRRSMQTVFLKKIIISVLYFMGTQFKFTGSFGSARTR